MDNRNVVVCDNGTGVSSSSILITSSPTCLILHSLCKSTHYFIFFCFRFVLFASQFSSLFLMCFGWLANIFFCWLIAVRKMWICWGEFSHFCVSLCGWKAAASLWRITHRTGVEGLWFPCVLWVLFWVWQRKCWYDCLSMVGKFNFQSVWYLWLHFLLRKTVWCFDILDSVKCRLCRGYLLWVKIL